MEFLRFAATVVGSATVVAAVLTLVIHGLIKHSEQKTSSQQQPSARRIAI
jgi:hypothetical protein